MALHQETHWGHPYSFVKPTSTDKGAIPRRLQHCGSVQSSSAQLPRDTFENLTVLLKTWGWKKSASVCLMNRPLTTSFSLLLLPRGWAKASVHPTSAKHCAPLPCPARGGWTTVATQFPSCTSLCLIAAVILVLYRACRAPSKIQHLGKMESNLAHVLGT